MNKKKDKKLKVRFVPNNDISEGEEQAIWNDVFDLLLRGLKLLTQRVC